MEGPGDFPLAATLYTPEGSHPAGTIVINGAMGVQRRYYAKFAEFLCTQGFRVVTYDYRGIGDSLERPLRQMNVSVHDWATQDFPSVVDAVTARYPGDKVILVGHSFGGQILGLARNSREICAMLSMTTPSGYWRHWPAPRRYVLAGLWYVLMPVLTAVCSYFPARRLGLGENLPAGVARQWASWCRQPQYSVKDANANQTNRYSEFSGPILSLSFDDDTMASKPAVDAIHGLYTGAKVERRHLRAKDFPPGRIGHFGFFKLPPDHVLWAEALAWLKSV